MTYSITLNMVSLSKKKNLDIVNKIQSNIDKGIFSCRVFIDLQRAFDTIDHQIFLRKLWHYRVQGVINTVPPTRFPARSPRSVSHLYKL